MLKKIYHGLTTLIMGKRPFNTIFSFNYHNIRPIVDFLIRAKKKISSQNNVLLDIGAGGSPYFDIFSDISKEYIAVDLETSLPADETRNIIQKVGTNEKLPIESKSVDIVLSNQVLEHVLDEKKAVEEVARVLKNGGIFIGSAPHISPIHLEPYDYRRFTRHGLKKLFEDYNFKVIEIEGNGGVHKAMAVTLTMDWYLSKAEEGKPQTFSNHKHLIFFPINGLINLIAILGRQNFWR